jgi:hypothetical protein
VSEELLNVSSWRAAFHKVDIRLENAQDNVGKDNLRKSIDRVQSLSVSQSQAL